MLLLYVSMLTVWTAGSTLGVAQAQQPVAQEQWVNPGVSIPPTTDLSKFVKKMDGAIVGTLERVSMVFLDPSDPNTLHTVLTFRMKEWLFGALPERAKTQIDVLLHGGTFVEQNGKRVPKQPTEVARNLTIGAEYFVPIEDGDKFGGGRADRLMLGSSIAMSRLDGGDVVPVVRNMACPIRSSPTPGSRWRCPVRRRARATSSCQRYERQGEDSSESAGAGNRGPTRAERHTIPISRPRRRTVDASTL